MKPNEPTFRRVIDESHEPPARLNQSIFVGAARGLWRAAKIGDRPTVLALVVESAEFDAHARSGSMPSVSSFGAGTSVGVAAACASLLEADIAAQGRSDPRVIQAALLLKSFVSDYIGKVSKRA